MNWDDLRFVLAVSREGALSRAATTLGVTHTTVGRRLSACEETLGVRLFDRKPEGFVPTPAGEDVIETAERTESDMLLLQGRVMGRDAELRGPLYVSILDFLYPLIHDPLTDFVARYPRVDVTITTPIDPVSLVRREADVVVRLSGAPPEGLIGVRVGQVEFAAFVSPELAARVGANAPLEAFPWLGLDRRQGEPRLVAWLDEHAPGARVVVRMDENSMLARELVTSGVGAYFLPVFEGLQRGLVQLSFADTNPFAPLWILTLPQLRRTSRVRAFIDQLKPALTQLLSAPKD